jgi:hypothetical protein
MALVVSRPDLPGFNPLDIDEVHTPARYCYFFSVPGRPIVLFFIAFECLFMLCVNLVSSPCVSLSVHDLAAPWNLSRLLWNLNPEEICPGNRGLNINEPLDFTVLPGDRFFLWPLRHLLWATILARCRYAAIHDLVSTHTWPFNFSWPGDSGIFFLPCPVRIAILFPRT